MMQQNIIPLSSSQISRIQAILESEYTICDSYGMCGSHCLSVSIVKADGTKHILKCSLVETEGWIDFQLARHKDVFDFFTTAYQESGVNFETIESYGQSYYIARYLGKPLGQCIANMSLECQKKVARQLALFLYSIHKNTNTHSKPFKSYTYPSLLQISDYFSSFRSNEDILLIKKVSEAIELYRNSVFPTVFIHGDFRSDNILYCEETGMLSVIDFECSGFSNVLREFAIDAPSALGFTYKFWYLVIDAYCSIGDTAMTPEIVRTLMMASLIHEYGRCAISERATGSALQMRYQYMKDRLEKLVKEFG